MTHVLETQRIRLREFRLDDLDDLAPMVADEEQMRFYPRPRTRDEASAWISRNLSLYRKHGFGFWVMESTGTSEFAGYCGIRPQTVDGVTEIEMGWHTRKKFWNRGFATEAASACRDLAFTGHRLPRLVGIIHPENLASRRVAERLGLRPEKTIILDECPWVIYAIEHPGLSLQKHATARINMASRQVERGDETTP